MFLYFFGISSNQCFFAICSPLFDERLAAGWLILSLLAIFNGAHPKPSILFI
jgi:hypothetical protein